MGANFTPSFENYTQQGKFRFWCQTVLPLIYDDSLSYMELLNKMVVYLNNTIQDVAAVESNVDELLTAYNNLQQYVNDYFDNLDVQNEINHKLDVMAEDGSLSDLIQPFIEAGLPGLVETDLPGVVENQIGDVVAGQIDDVVGEQIGGVVAEQIPTQVTGWLDDNVTPVGSAVVVDSSLSISGAAADAKVTGGIRTKYNESNNYMLSQIGMVHSETDNVTFSEQAVYYTDGALYSNNTLNHSNYIDILDGYKKLLITAIVKPNTVTANVGIAFYSAKSASSYISGVAYNTTDETSYNIELKYIDIPVTAKYVRCNWFKEDRPEYSLYSFRCELIAPNNMQEKEDADNKDAKQTKKALSEIYSEIEYTPNITNHEGWYITGDNAGTQYNSNYRARTGKTQAINAAASGFRNMLYLDSNVYEYAICLYDVNSQYIDSIGYTNDYIFLPNTAKYFAITFHRKDNAVIADAEIADIQTAIKAYSFTDKTLSKENKIADAKAVSDAVELSKNLFYLTGETVTNNGITATRNSDGTITFNGTASASASFYIMGASNSTTSNLDSNSYYLVRRKNISGEYSSLPSIRVLDSVHTSSILVNNNTFYHTNNNARFYLSIPNGATFTNAVFGFSVTKGEEWVAITNRNTFSANDAYAREWIKTYKTKTTDEVFFNITTDRPMAFNSTEYTTETESIECILRLPNSYRPVGKPTRLILCCHGSGGYVDSEQADGYKWNNTSWKSFADTMVSAGYALFDTNIFPKTEEDFGEHYGSPLYVQNCYKAYQYIIENYNVYKEIFVHGYSMGNVAANAFANIYSNITLAQSSFAGRDITEYINRWKTNYYSQTTMTKIAKAWGYNSINEAEADGFNNLIGYYPSLGLTKTDEYGQVIFALDSKEHLNDWLNYYCELDTYLVSEITPNWFGNKKRPYKAWISWTDREQTTKLETVLQKAYNRANACPYYLVIYEDETHGDLCYGNVADAHMREQLINYYKQFE